MRRLAECRLDSLEELELAMSEPDISEPELPPLITAPRLRKTRLTIWSDAPPVLIPWAQLTNLTLTSDSPNIILEILAQCTTLTYAYIRTPAWRAYVAPQLKQPLPSSHLHTLSLDFGYPEHMMHFLGSLSTPALEALHLNFTWVRDAMESEEPLAGFLIRTPNITRLEILSGRHALTSHELIAVIEHTPGLTHLKLAFSRYHFLDNALIDALSYKDDVAPLVPHLHNLVLNNIHQNGFSTDALEHLFVSRWADATSSSGLPSVARWSHLELRGKYSEESANMMEKLQRQGLPLELQFQKSSRTLLPNYKLPLRMEGDF
ncbi:hypothetical protein C8R45DRAFT_1021108 [Mycena sanguinolenta]|nr:hypothetical protein C8R45DRAFT_1021108 [Mycena sanguinolenta]